MLWPIDTKGRVCTGVVMIPTLRRVSGVLPLTCRLADPSTTFLVIISLSIMIAAVINDAVHGVVPAISQFIGIEPET